MAYISFFITMSFLFSRIHSSSTDHAGIIKYQLSSWPVAVIVLSKFQLKIKCLYQSSKDILHIKLVLHLLGISNWSLTNAITFIFQGLINLILLQKQHLHFKVQAKEQFRLHMQDNTCVVIKAFQQFQSPQHRTIGRFSEKQDGE